jgi:hypothetical protein
VQFIVRVCDRPVIHTKTIERTALVILSIRSIYQPSEVRYVLTDRELGAVSMCNVSASIITRHEDLLQNVSVGVVVLIDT